MANRGGGDMTSRDQLTLGQDFGTRIYENYGFGASHNQMETPANGN